MFDVARMRAQFPITRERFRVTGQDEPQPLVYLDHAASTHPPAPVLDTYRTFLEHSYANVHRGRHTLSEMATDRFEHVADDVLALLGARGDRRSLVLCGNTTQALDLAAHVMAGVPGATLVSLMEHHSNDLPHRRRGAVRHFGVLADGTLDHADLEARLAAGGVKLVAVTAASNVTGAIVDVHRVARLAHAHGARVLVDAAQALAHLPLDVRPEGDPEHLDFVAGAGHKAYAPFGSAFLYGPPEVFDAAPPYVPGGGTVDLVTTDDALFRPSPERHEAGTPNIAGAVALAAALRFLREVGLDAIRAHERALVEQALDGLARLGGVRVLGHPDPARRIGVISLVFDDVGHELAATVLNQEAAIAVRNGCFCAHPYLHRLLGVTDTDELRRKVAEGRTSELPGAVRPSFGIFNTEEEVELLLRMIRVVRDRAWKGEYAGVPSPAPAGACGERAPGAAPPSGPIG
jgi:selenocysteine lyase/cysteine desulfurase